MMIGSGDQHLTLKVLSGTLDVGNLSLPPPQKRSTNTYTFNTVLSRRYFNITKLYFFLSLFMLSTNVFAQRGRIDNFVPIIEEIQNDLLVLPTDGFVPPTEKAFQDFAAALRYFRAGSLDSCRLILGKHHYSLTELTDGKTGATYDMLKENHPAHKGWGTFIFNRNFTKRLNIEVDHPADDANTLTIAVDLFRHSHAAWLLIAGTGKRAGDENGSADVARARKSIFQLFHEGLTDPTYMSLSLHGYSKKFYQSPISGADVIISNGKTTDDQWGISQISLAYRDSLRNAGFPSWLAMYDSGYAALGGGGNVQGMFTNDSVGFGHWINVELSNVVRESPAEYSRFIAATDRALDLSGKKIAQLLNKAFGLVTPRVLRIDSAHPIMFPPPSQQTYRIISFNAGRGESDTLNLHVGQWVDLFKSDKSMSSIRTVDTADDEVSREFRRARQVGIHTTLANIVDPGSDPISSIVNLGQTQNEDSLLSDPQPNPATEPLQVHRIPIQPIVIVRNSDQDESIVNSYRWSGIVHAGFSSSIPVFQMSNQQAVISEDDVMPNFLIPILRNSYDNGRSKFVGIQMTKVLVQEIARLVAEQEHHENDVSILAEESGTGDYFLRVIPAAAPTTIAELKK